MTRVFDEVRPVASSPLAVLRRATRTQHDHVDRRLQFLLAQPVPRDDYVAVLRALVRVHRATEAFVARCTDRFDVTMSPFAWRPRTLVGHLEDDLRSWGVTVEGMSPFEPTIGLGGFVGTCYVIEGSALGARVIAPQVDRALDAPRRQTYFSTAAYEGARRWREFGDFANTVLHDDRDLASATYAASLVFDSIEQALDDEMSARS